MPYLCYENIINDIRFASSLKENFMQIFNLEQDFDILCMDVPTFPNGIPETFDKLSKLLPLSDDRVFYGISYMDEAGKIIYKAAASMKSPDEASDYNCEQFTITKGEYLAETITNWMKNIPKIGKTFQEMIRDKRVVNKKSVCIEWYKTDNELMCMVKIK